MYLRFYYQCNEGHWWILSRQVHGLTYLTNGRSGKAEEGSLLLSTRKGKIKTCLTKVGGNCVDYGFF